MQRFKKWKDDKELWNAFLDAGGTVKKDGKGRYGLDDWAIELGDKYYGVEGTNTVHTKEYDSDMGTILDAENDYVTYEKGKDELNSDILDEIKALLGRDEWVKTMSA